jgi:hypothetical protein
MISFISDSSDEPEQAQQPFKKIVRAVANPEGSEATRIFALVGAAAASPLSARGQQAAQALIITAAGNWH